MGKRGGGSRRRTAAEEAAASVNCPCRHCLERMRERFQIEFKKVFNFKTGPPELTEDAAFAEGTGVLQQQPGVHALSVVLVKTRQHPQTLAKGDTTNMEQ